MDKKQNRFGTPGIKNRESTKERFSDESQKHLSHLVEEKKSVQKRKGYKGERKQIGIRLQVKTVEDIAFIGFLTGKKQVELWEECIEELVGKEMEKLKKEHGEMGLKKLREIFKRKA